MQTEISSPKFAMFSRNFSALKRYISQLDDTKDLSVANYLIAQSIESIYDIMDIFLEKGFEADRGGEQYDKFIRDAHKMEQQYVDRKTIGSLKNISNILESMLNTDAAKRDLKKLNSRLDEFDRISEEDLEDKDTQKLFDQLFSDSFERLISLINAHYPHLIKEKN